MKKFLKRTYDDKTRTWSYIDGSGKIRDEARIMSYNNINIMLLMALKEKYRQ